MVEVTYCKDPDNKNNFYDRYVTSDIAMTNGQLSATNRQHKRDTGEKELFSEDLYYND